jgi:hypothetical protein
MSFSYVQQRSENWLTEQQSIRYRIILLSAQRWFSLQRKDCPTTRSRPAWIHAVRSSVSGGNGSSRNVSQAWRTGSGPDGPGLFPPEIVVQVKAIACEMPSKLGVPLSRWSIAELGDHVRCSGLVASISDSTIWRWLDEDAIRPWQHRCWIFPRDPNFVVKAGPILDLYQRQWKGRRLLDDELVLSSDEKTSIQARARIHPTLPTEPGRPMRVEHEYKRRGAWAYIAALDVHRAKVFGRCEAKTGIAPFGRLVDQVMAQPPYSEARRVFWIVDNGTSHRGERAVKRLQSKYPRLVLVHTPVHASWLNQIEIYFSIVQRKALTPNDFASLDAVRERLFAFERHYERIGKPFEWTFNRQDLKALMDKLSAGAVAA